ncbi:GNAT family N-acetyltransferase ['Paenibacillus yunnanensis' Narsing Rao et al. 2020]|uniref:GNAT family N-acetyltransferase n=1 Tax=Paenibacillus tengchongensis TaxID=2608684 RepID=UPI00124C4C12|nr:GNAT family N-acetyltransferase [Paenibacillus tengchongensis]
MNITESWISKENSKVRPKLLQYNLAQAAGKLSDKVDTVELTMADGSGEIKAGITASIYWRQMHVDFLWVDESLRGQQVGTKLLEQAEQLARKHGCRYIRLETFSFQAPDFYQKLGFTIFGVLDDSPYDGAKEYYLKKELR